MTLTEFPAEIWGGDLGTDSEFELQNSESVPRSPQISQISAGNSVNVTETLPGPNLGLEIPGPFPLRHSHSLKIFTTKLPARRCCVLATN